MRRSTSIMLALTFLTAAGIWYGLYWFYRVPPEGRRGEGAKAERIDEGDLVSAGPVEGGIPSIDAPEFESVAAADQYLKEDGLGLDVEYEGEHRFYPYQVLAWHEIVNDTFGVEPIVVTFDPLCMSGIVFSRIVEGQVRAFDTTGTLWNNNLVMKDRETGTRWNQILGVSLDGAKELTRYPAITMTWSDWKRAYPKGEVLSRETGFARDYTRDPYGNYARTPAVWYPLTYMDARLSAKTLVYGVTLPSTRSGQTARAAYPVDVVEQVGEIRDTIDGIPVLISYDEDLGVARAYRLTLDGEAGDPALIEEAFWFVWAAAFPGVQLYELP